MANINNINDVAQSMGKGPARDIKNKTGPSFENALSKAIDKNQEAVAKPGMVKGLQEIAAPDLKLNHPAKAITSQTGNLLNLLDDFSGKLQDPAVSLKSIYPMVDKLNQTAETLLNETQKLGSSDSVLKEIATQTAVTARNEYIKFQRGDYLS